MTFAIEMRPMITIYGLLISAISGFALLSLCALSLSLIDHWRYVNPDDESLHPWTMNAPLIAKVGMVIPGLLLIVSVLSFKRGMISDRLLIHGIAVTALALATISVFVVLAGMIPSIVTITEMPNP